MNNAGRRTHNMHGLTRDSCKMKGQIGFELYYKDQQSPEKQTGHLFLVDLEGVSLVLEAFKGGRVVVDSGDLKENIFLRTTKSLNGRRRLITLPE